MNHSQTIHIPYLGAEIRSIKELLLTLDNTNAATHYKEELMQLEEDFLNLRASTRGTNKLLSPSRQQVPDINQPPVPAPDAVLEGPLPTPIFPPIPPPEPSFDRVFTLEELSTYDGLENRPAYVGLNGIVFDMTNVATWGGGTHFGLMAGTDVTAGARACSYHAQEQLMRILRPIGRLIESVEPTPVFDPNIVAPSLEPVLDTGIPNNPSL